MTHRATACSTFAALASSPRHGGAGSVTFTPASQLSNVFSVRALPPDTCGADGINEPLFFNRQLCR
eukprot:m.293539 g.293539  ORF g.293539 m.293539 type:complete len:66 (+) comp20022_c0_seq11:1378-1575(+)